LAISLELTANVVALPLLAIVPELRYLYSDPGPEGKLIQAKYFGKVSDDIPQENLFRTNESLLRHRQAAVFQTAARIWERSDSICDWQLFALDTG
jgi:hypothetical protein